MTDTPVNPHPPGKKELQPSGSHRVLWNTAGVAIALISVVLVLGFWGRSQQFQDMIRSRIARQLQTVTGGRVDIGAFHWRPLRLDAEARNIVIHGDEKPNEEPYARVDDLKVKFSILSLWTPTIRLRELDVLRPRLHLIIYPDGATNQPRPEHPQKSSGGNGVDTLFKMKAGKVDVDDGIVHIDDRAASLDFQDRYQPLDFRADDFTLDMNYIAATAGAPDRYHVDTSVRNIELSREGALHGKLPQVHGVIQAAFDLEQNSLRLISARIISSTKGAPDRQLDVTGSIVNFTHPVWQANVTGDLDLRLLDPVLGYPFAPEGIAHLQLTSGGQGDGFHIDGTVHAAKAAYIGTGVVARGIDLTTRVHADEQALRITNITARLAAGGEITGEILLNRWLPPSAPVVMQAAAKASPPPGRSRFGLHRAPEPISAPATTHDTVVKSPKVNIPVDGKVNAEFHNLPLDTILDLVGQPPFQRLGLAALVNGSAQADWVHGDVNTLGVNSKLTLSPFSRAGETPTSGVIDATYTQRDGTVEVRTLTLGLPASHIEAHGRLGAYPLTSPTALAMKFQSRNLSEFDTVFRDLGVVRRGKAGAAALPVALGGQADFNGIWSGSLLSPRLEGNLTASDVSVELPPALGSDANQSQTIHWDTIAANGAYDARRISVVHADLRRGPARVQLEGTLTAASAIALGTVAGKLRPHLRGDELPAFDAGSVLSARIQAEKVPFSDLQPFLSSQVAVTGTVDAQLAVEGPIRSVGGSGWVQLTGGSIEGEPVKTLHAQGSLADRTVSLSSINAELSAGGITGHGAYNLDSHRFDLQAQSGALQLARIESLRSSTAVDGKLGFSVEVSGTQDDPRVEGRATVSGLTVGGESLGAVELTAHTANHVLLYEANSRSQVALFKASGQIQMASPWTTNSHVDFSQLDAGAFFRMARISSITAQSALSGSATIEGPLERPAELRGDMRIEPAQVLLAGVHLRSEGALHASMQQSRITVDPMHITGDDTDLRAQASLALKDDFHLDFAASGTVNLKLAESLDSDLVASGVSSFQVEAHGPLSDPGLRGRLLFQNGSVALEDLPNSLSQLNGTLEFNQNRLEVKSLTAMTGGGQLTLGGYLAYQHGLYADVTMTGRGVRIRYPQGVSSLADADLRLQGPQSNLLLSGKILLTRFSISPDLDIAALASQATTVSAVVPPESPSNHVRLDVQVQSSPQLNFQNAYAKLAGDFDLRVRGTLASPSLLGRVSVTEGNATIAGTRYELQRGEITFTNPVRIQPNIDLNATARVEDYDISLGLHGTPDKMSVTYRSDPPLPEADVVALLALGRTQSEQGLYTQQQQHSAGLNQNTDVLLGGALNATVSSRVQKLFGAGSVKVDPSYLGALGNSTTRITVEEQLGKNVTLVYATNVDTSAQQFLQAEVAINRHVSLQVTRDESGVFSMVIKAVRRYR